MGTTARPTADLVLEALRGVQDPDLKRDLVTLGMIEELEVGDERVSFTLVLTTAACPLKEQIEGDARAAVAALPGVREVVIRTTSRVRKPKDPTADRKALTGVAHVIAVELQRYRAPTPGPGDRIDVAAFEIIQVRNDPDDMERGRVEILPPRGGRG